MPRAEATIQPPDVKNEFQGTLQPEPPKPRNDTEVVYIGCKLPHGIWLEHIPRPIDPQSNIARNPGPSGPKVRLRGANDLSVQLPRHKNPANLRAAITVVSKSFWDKWVAEYSSEYEWYRNGFVYEAKSATDAEAKGNERLSARTGFEPITPAADGKIKDDRFPMSISADQDQMAKRG